MTDDIIVRMRHVRAAKLCSRGGRAWMADRGMNWSDFLTNGLPMSQLRALNDPFANRACDAAEEESRLS